MPNKTREETLEKIFEYLKLWGVLGESNTLYLQNDFTREKLAEIIEKIVCEARLSGAEEYQKKIAEEYQKKIKEMIESSDSWEELKEKLRQ